MLVMDVAVIVRMVVGVIVSTMIAMRVIMAMNATVIAVPSPIMKVAATPAQNRPCASANTSTMNAPEHGRSPTATMADNPRCQPPGPASSSGSGPWAWPQAEACSSSPW